MSNREFFVQCWKNEMPAFARVIRALPNDKLDYTHHERSAQAGNLAWQIAEEAQGIIDIATKGETTHAPSQHPGSGEAMASHFEKAAGGVPDAVLGMSDEQWESPAKLIMGGQPVWEAPRGQMIWGYLFDMVHHRGQLSTYIRPMGGKVPSIYGPSADDMGG
jgi:uncharacterized damage-inducible protein DinB